MIIYNQDKISSRYLSEDNTVIEINSNKRLEELLEMVRGGEDISSVATLSILRVDSESTFHKTYRPRTLDIRTADENVIFSHDEAEDYQNVIPNYNMIYDEDYDGDDDPFTLDAGQKPFMEKRQQELNTAFEQNLFGVKSPKLTFDAIEEMPADLLMEQLACAIGIMPHLLFAEETKDLSVTELKKLSASAEIGYDKTIAIYWANTYPAVLPTAETALKLQALSVPERNIISEGFISPEKATDIMLAMKEANPHCVLTRSAVMECANPDGIRVGQIREIATAWATGRYYDSDTFFRCQGFIAALSDAFREKFHNFVPRVIREYGMPLYLTKPNDKSEEAYIAEITDNFSRQNLSVIAAIKSPPLYALSKDLNFGEIKQEHISAIAAYYPADVTGLIKLTANHFAAYYKKYASEITLGELQRMLELYAKEIVQNQDFVFEENIPPKKLIQKLENRRAYEDCAKFEERHHYRFEDNDLAIRGRNIVVSGGDLKMYMLPADDPRNFTVGYDTHCCQVWGNAGSSCVHKLTTDPYAGVTVIERKGRVVAQAFTWTDESKDTLVFDNMEFADDREVQQFSDIIAAWAREMPYANIHVGTGYNQHMGGWGRKVDYMAQMPQVAGPTSPYSDYHASARAIKKNREMLISTQAAFTVVHEEQAPSRYDLINDMGFGYLLGTGYSLDKLVEIAGKVQSGSLTEQEYMDVFRATANHEALLRNMPEIPESVQLWLMDVDKAAVQYIQNPCRQILLAQVHDNPLKIREMEDPEEDIMLEVVSVDGLYLSEIKNPTPAVCKKAVQGNGLAIRFVPPQMQTDEICQIAVDKWPRAILGVANPTEELLCLALSKEPSLVSLAQMAILPVCAQMTAVQADPEVINSIRYPDPSVVEYAIRRDGRLIRNFQNSYPQLRSVALAQNPEALSALHNPTVDEILQVYHVLGDARTARLVHNPEALAQARQAVTAMELGESDMDAGELSIAEM